MRASPEEHAKVMCVFGEQMGVEKLNNLAVLYASNNKISSFDDIAASTKLPELKELLLAGNPLYKEWADKGETAQYRIEVKDFDCTCNNVMGAAAPALVSQAEPMQMLACSWLIHERG